MAKRLARIGSILQSARDAFACGANDSALILLYSALDILGSVQRAPGHRRGSGEDFRRWLDRYVLAHKSLPVTSEDLWGARCGIVHALNHESDWSDRGKARILLYCTGETVADSGLPWSEVFRRVIAAVPSVSKLPAERLVIVHLGTLLDAVWSGFQQYVDEVLEDEELDRQLTERLDVALTSFHVFRQ